METLDRADVVATGDRDPIGEPCHGNRAMATSSDNRHDLGPLHTPGETGGSTKGALEKAGSGRARKKGGTVYGQVGETTARLFKGRHRLGMGENGLV